MKYYQQGGGQQGDVQGMMQQIAQAFQQLPPEAQQQLLQGLSQMVQQGGAPQEQQGQQQAPSPEGEAMMRMGGFRSRPNSNMYR